MEFYSINPYGGCKVVLAEDFFGTGFAEKKLEDTYMDLKFGDDPDLLLESASFAEFEATLPLGEPVDPNFILEAIVIQHFSQTDKQMAKLARIFNRRLEDGLKIDLQGGVLVGKVKKNSSFAYVPVQFLLGDGQTVSVLFHAPVGDRRKIAPDSTLVAYRWLLNKKDITEAVAPEDGEEISGPEMASRIAQLAKRNSAAFRAKKDKAAKERQELDEAKKALEKFREEAKATGAASEELGEEARKLESEYESLGTRLQRILEGNIKLKDMITTLENAKEAAEKAALAAKKAAQEEADRKAKKAKEEQEEAERKAKEEAKQKAQEEPGFVAELQAIADGKHDGEKFRAISGLLKKLIGEVKSAGLLEKYKNLVNAASDWFTGYLSAHRDDAKNYL